MWDRVSPCDQAVMIAGKAYYRVVVAPQRSWWPRIYVARGCLRLTSEARLALTRAEDEARRLRHRYIGTEHILLGLLHDGEGSATSALSCLGVGAESIRREVEEIIGYGQAPVPDDELLPLTPRAAASLRLSRKEALRLGDQQLGTEHVLLGLIAEGEGVAAQVLKRAGADQGRVRAVLRWRLSGQRYQAGHRQGSEHNGQN